MPEKRGGKNIVEMEGRRFGALTVLSRAPDPGRNALWTCRCDCGTECAKVGFRLRQGRVKTCGQNGCSWRNFRPAATRRREDETRRIWRKMRERCRHKKFKYWGGMGVKVCERWQTFENFLTDLGPRPSKLHSIDRYPDPNGDYEPGNCRWALVAEQARNRRNPVFVVYKGKKVRLLDVPRSRGVSIELIRSRLFLGWTLERALEEPLRKKRGTTPLIEANKNEHRWWERIKKRCLDPSYGPYDWYGGRGVRMEAAWQTSFEAFLRDVGKAPSKEHVLSWEDSDKGYTRGNVQWTLV